MENCISAYPIHIISDTHTCIPIAQLIDVGRRQQHVWLVDILLDLCLELDGAGDE
jgi:hypothetical protein